MSSKEEILDRDQSQENSQLDINETIVVKSASRVCLGSTHPGRPENEEPHVKKTMKNKREITEYICKVDQDQLGILEEEFDDLKELFKMFDVDQDGILNLMEVQHVLRCLGFRGTNAQSIERLVSEVGVDQTHHSLSFNEYLTLISVNRRSKPTKDSLFDAFINFDPEKTGKISEQMLRQILKTKEVPERDITEMITEYKKLDFEKDDDEDGEEIYYAEFIKMLTA